MRGLVIYNQDNQPETVADDYWNQWSYLLQHSTPDEVYIFGASELPPNKILKDATLLADLADLPGGIAVVLADGNAPDSLMDYAHPADCYYVFGPDHENADWLGFTFTASFYIPPVESINLLFSYEAAAMVGYDRGLKEYQAAP